MAVKTWILVYSVLLKVYRIKGLSYKAGARYVGRIYHSNVCLQYGSHNRYI